jgi:hypothetical protein
MWKGLWTAEEEDKGEKERRGKRCVGERRLRGGGGIWRNCSLIFIPGVYEKKNSCK